MLEWRFPGAPATGPPGADPCTFGGLGGASKGDPFFDVTNSMADLQDTRFKAASETLWN